MRGDPPKSRHPQAAQRLSTPHARGSTLMGLALPPHTFVYPACAGIHPWIMGRDPMKPCLPRMRGDPPEYVTVGNEKE